MTILTKLASFLDRRDETPNQKLAKEIADTSNNKAIKELVENLTDTSKNAQNDCIKVLHEKRFRACIS